MKCYTCKSELDTTQFGKSSHRCLSCERTRDRERSKRPDSIYRAFTTRSKKKGIQFSLSKSQFKEKITSNCYYCRINGRMGLDRVNNDLGYTLENTVACCGICNRMKSNQSQEDFINKCKMIAKPLYS